MKLVISGRKIAWGIGGFVAGAAGAFLILWSLLPYGMAESGQHSYIESHQAEIVLGVLAGVGLLVFAGYCFRRTMGWKAWAITIGVIALMIVGRTLSRGGSAPPDAEPVGNRFYVSRTARPNEADTIMYHVYYRNGRSYVSVESQVSEYALAGSDCLLFRGLVVSGHPRYAMCGYRSPVETYDTLIADSELLRQARAQGRYRDNWRSNR